MKIAVFVHDLFLEIGHSHAVIETLRNLPQEQIESLTIVAFRCDNTSKLFPKLAGKVTWVKVPFPNLYPFILKMFFYHLYGLIYSLKLDSKTIKLSVGIASLNPDIVNVQFVHQQWEEHFFKIHNPKGLRYLYKKVLFFYFRCIENYVYFRKHITLICLSRFVQDYCLKTFKLPKDRCQVSYSGVNLSKFGEPCSKIEALQELVHDYPQLSELNLNSPICLFVGAYERKGLPQVFQSLKNRPGTQLLVIGSPSSGESLTFPQHIKIFKIKFTSKLPLFYSLADTFIFPSIYEPFGLVIIEAAAMGLEIYATKNRVGACEILEGLPAVHCIDSPYSFEVKGTRVLPLDEKKEIRRQRIDRLKNYTWKATAKTYYQVFKSLK